MLFRSSATSNPWTRNRLSMDLRSSLKECLLSPYLHELRIRGVDLPISVIAHFTHLKRFALHSADFYDDPLGGSPNSSIIASIPGRLEALELSRLAEPLPAAMALLTQELRLLSIASSDPNTLFAAGDVIKSSETSIHAIIWQEYSYYRMFLLNFSFNLILNLLTVTSKPTIQLGMIRSLQYLCFSLVMMKELKEKYFDAGLASIVTHLEDGAVSTTVKELTIYVDHIFYPSYASLICPLEGCKEWDALDSVLVDRSPALQKVHIFVKVQNNDHSDLNAELQLRMQTRLPRLAERGVLVTKFGTLEELQKIAWTRSWPE